MTRQEKANKEYEEMQKRKEEERLELEEALKQRLEFDDIKVLSVKERNEENYDLQVNYSFTLDGFTQEDHGIWSGNESIEQFVDTVKKRIGYIKQLRQEYSEYCKQNDFIQKNRRFGKLLNLTHMGYKRTYCFDIELADYMKLPNTTSCGFGGGDYEIKRTPVRVKEYNENIDKAIDFMIDCIAELKNMKYKESEENQ